MHCNIETKQTTSLKASNPGIVKISVSDAPKNTRHSC